MSPGSAASAPASMRGHRVGAEFGDGGFAEGVGVGGGGVLQAGERVLGQMLGGAGRDLFGVAGQDAGQDVDGGVGVGGFRGEDPVRVGFGGGQVDVVFVGAARHRDVELLAGEVVAADQMAGAGDSAFPVADGDALHGVDGGGVAEGDVRGDVGGRQGGAPPGVEVAHPQAAGVGDVLHLPAVSVAHVVGGADPQPAGVAAGADDVAGRGAQRVGEGDFGDPTGRGVTRGGVGEPVVAGAVVEGGDEVVGGGQQQRVAAGGAVGAPAGVGQLRGGRVGADMHAAVVDEERQRGGIAVAQMPGGLGFGGVLKPHHLDQGAGAVFAADVAQHPAGGDRCQLLVVADEPNAGAAGHGVADDGVQFQGAGLAGFVDDEQRVGPDAVEPVPGGVPVMFRVVVQPHVFGDGVGGGDADLLAQHFGGRGAGREPDDGAAAVFPRPGEGGHRGGLAGPGRGERQ